MFNTYASITIGFVPGILGFVIVPKHFESVTSKIISVIDYMNSEINNNNGCGKLDHAEYDL